MVPAPLNVDSHQVQPTSSWTGLEQVVPHLDNTATITARVTASVTVSTRGTVWGTATSRLQLQLQLQLQ